MSNDSSSNVKNGMDNQSSETEMPAIEKKTENKPLHINIPTSERPPEFIFWEG